MCPCSFKLCPEPAGEGRNQSVALTLEGEKMSRIIGIRHRRKKTSKEEARPTMVAIKSNDGKVVCYELANDTAELDFLMNRFPIEWQPIQPGDDISCYQAHHLKWRKVAKDEDTSLLNINHMRKTTDKKGLPVVEVAVKIPVMYDGLFEGDRVAMVLGGSGDRFAAALSRKGEDINAKVYRLPPFSLASNRNDDDKKNDHLNLIRIFEEKPELFYQVRRRDRELVRVKGALSARQDALKQRIACEQSILQSLNDQIFLNEEGCFPEGVIEEQFNSAKANDTILQSLLEEEDRRNKKLASAVEALDIWKRIFKNIEGVGPRLAAGIIAPIADIRRFMAPNGSARLKKFCGVHVMDDGRFPRRRAGELANWSPWARQALYLLADQFNRRPNSDWGKKLLHYKLVLRQRHPEPIEAQNSAGIMVKRFTNGHIHRMAQWRTLTKFVEWLYKQWIRIENEKSEV